MNKTNDHLMRQLDIIPTDVLNEPITIIGAGAVGSFTALSLAKMGFTDITVYDFDMIEIENMNCQFYRMNDIGTPKVQALGNLIQDFTGEKIDIKNEKYVGGSFPGIVISAVDNMKVRRLIWDSHKSIAFMTKLIIDPRMAAEQGLIFAMNPMDQKDIKAYELSLYTDEKALQERCTAKSTMYTSLFLAGQVCKIVKDFTTSNGKKYTRITTWNIGENIMECIAA